MKRMGTIEIIAITAVIVISLCIPGTGFTQDDDAENKYVGSTGCGMCHMDNKNLWSSHGHSMMLRPVENGTEPENTDAITLPEDVQWNKVTWLIGGAKNYARFTDENGFVMTGEGKQWSIDGGVHTAFKPDIPNGTLEYSCVKCHSVGWSETASDDYDNAVVPGLDGIPGGWFESGVGCEACHGMGHQHVILEDKKELKEEDEDADLNISITKSADLCAECHRRNQDDSIIVVAEDLTRSRQQHSEWKHSKKGRMGYPRCADCHNPHGTSENEENFVQACTECHSGDFAMPVKIRAMQGLACTDCHMPLASRGAYDTMKENYHHGDTVSHIFGISVDPEYTLDDGSGMATVTEDGLVRMTVEMTCYRCHQSGEVHEMTREQLLDMAEKVH